MAKMIPNWIDSDAPGSEKRVFNLIKNDPDAADWTVLHSLMLSKRGKKPYGEIDFVVIIPGEGIVCVEVKGGGVSVRDGVWRSEDRFGKTHVIKNPFAQAKESMFGLKDYIENRGAANARTTQCPIGCMVIFPSSECPPLTPEFERWQVIDRDDIDAPISKSIKNFAQRRLRRFQPRHGSPLPSVRQANTVRNLLRPDFDRPSINQVEHVEKRIEKLTAEQYAKLDELEENDRCLFRGAAGTGKTLLAVEYARRAALQGDKVLLVCFNRLLARWLQRVTNDVENIKADTWHEVARCFILGSALKDEFRESENQAKRTDGWGNLFQNEYPSYAELAVDEYVEERGSPFDVLVVDEAQDILDEVHRTKFLDKALKGGLDGGRWAIFGDEKQTLFGEPADPAKALETHCAHFVKSRLSFNFRNAKPIVDEIVNLTGMNDQSFRTGVGDGPSVKRIYWRNAKGLARRLADEIARLTRLGIPPKDIVILSPRRLENSDLADVESAAGFRISDLTDREPKRSGTTPIAFSTIQAFKGMESPAIIVAGIDSVDSDWMRTTLYVGMSRAKTMLTLMIHQDAREDVERLLG